MPTVELDNKALYRALDAERVRRGVSWRRIAEATELSPAAFTRLANGSEPLGNSVLSMCDWLGIGVEAFTRRRGELDPTIDDALAASDDARESHDVTAVPATTR